MEYLSKSLNRLRVELAGPNHKAPAQRTHRCARMATSAEIREHLCRAIASLDSQCSLEDADHALSPILERYESVKTAATVQTGQGIGTTPLMVACDKAQVACIKWISQRTKKDQSLISLLGSPLDTAEAGNTPLHYAAYSGCSDALEFMSPMLGNEEPKPVAKLVSLTNDNCDTCIMISALKGDVAFLRQTLTLLQEEGNARNNSTKIFELANNEGETALSLSFGHGEAEIVNFLIQEAKVNVTFDTVKQAERKLDWIDDAMRAMPTPTEDQKNRRTEVHRCLIILKVALAKSTQEAMDHLLAEEGEATRISSKAKKEAKKKQKSKRSGSRGMRENGVSDKVDSIANPNIESKNDIQGVDGENGADVEVDAKRQAEPTGKEQAYRNTAQALTEPPPSDYVGTDLDVDAVVEALSLHPSMLLLNANDMASSLSPCQLDAVGAVLRNQIQAVNEARTIQDRLRNETT